MPENVVLDGSDSIQERARESIEEVLEKAQKLKELAEKRAFRATCELSVSIPLAVISANVWAAYARPDNPVFAVASSLGVGLGAFGIFWGVSDSLESIRMNSEANTREMSAMVAERILSAQEKK